MEAHYLVALARLLERNDLQNGGANLMRSTRGTCYAMNLEDRRASLLSQRYISSEKHITPC